MASVHRNFDINKSRRGDVGNIDISFVDEETLCVTVFGLNDGYLFAHMRVKHPTQMCLYDVCCRILDTITKDFKTVTYGGHEDFMYIETYDGAIDITKDPELLKLFHPNFNPPKFDFTRDTAFYLKKYFKEFNFEVDLPDCYKIIEGEVTLDGKFYYDFKTLYHHDDHMKWMR